VNEPLLKPIKAFVLCAWVGLLLVLVSFWMLSKPWPSEPAKDKTVQPTKPKDESFWTAPNESAISTTEEGELIRYGKELVSHTASYLGPNGKVTHISNGMNCQNCHLKAGTVPFGNNYSAVAANYPKYRDRSGIKESIERRVNDCIERSLNGKKLDSTSREMRAFVSYITWLGKDVPKKTNPKGVGLFDLKKLGRAADPVKGKIVFQETCARCHQPDGQGLREKNSLEWKYPPLWGKDSYNIGAGLYRLSRFAGYVKMNMPNDIASYEKPFLSDEQAWDVAAYINSMPRPTKDISMDWPKISTKPFDHPFGPYSDQFSEQQHKYGPFEPILEAKRKSKQNPSQK
jgi:thiosulfate dehydrogenase